LDECQNHTNKALKGVEINAKRLADLKRQRPNSDCVNHQPESNTQNPWKMMLESGRNYLPEMVADLEHKSQIWQDRFEQASAILDMKGTESYRLARQHAESVVAATRSGAIPNNLARVELLKQLEETADYATYWEASNVLDQAWYLELDRQIEEKRVSAAALENDAKKLEEHKD
jgi:hypothetical protein